jgi:two-component system, OmpR family, heavy metal sensor histidine kinase CusS
MKAPGIRLRLTAWYSLILVLSLCLFGSGAYFAMKGSIRATVNAELRQRLEGVRQIIDEDAPHGPPALEDELREYADGLGQGGLVRVADGGGHAFFASRGLETPPENTRGRKASLPFKIEINGEEFRVLRETIQVSGVPYDVTVGNSIKDFDRALARFRLALYAAVPVFLLLATFGGYWLSRSALAPVDEITRAARSIGAQDLARRLTVPRTCDELERLASTLNEMLARLDASFQRITQFTADASHELRTPVSVMRTSAELALRKPRTDSEYRESLSQILHESEKVSQLIEQLLLLARADASATSIPMQRLDATEPLCEACFQARPAAEAKRVAFHENLSAQACYVVGDAVSLERLFRILLDNAVKYTPSGGQIEVHLSTRDNFAIVEVRDTGIGISPEDMPHIFDRFYRADRARTRESGGIGLGLAIGRWIAEAHHGEIQVESGHSQGSTFRVRFPLSPE